MLRRVAPLMLLVALGCAPRSDLIERPNVLLIVIDDLNDWVGPLTGNSQSITPFLDEFRSKSVNFTRNYCPSPGCNPSRSAFLTGIHTFRSGMYSNYQDWRKVPKLINSPRIGQHFRQNGYFSAGAGKIFHYSQVDTSSWDAYFPSQKQNMPRNYIPEKVPVSMPTFRHMYRAFDWGPIPIEDSATGDFKSVQYISSLLKEDHQRPFFLATGIYRPHLPWYVPQKYFDLFPPDQIRLPELMENDTADLGTRARELISRGGNYHHHVTMAGQWKNAVQGYLASIAFADAAVGELLSNLEKSRYADNTIVIICSDHGWQLGEKMHWRKFALWENVIRTLMMIKVPAGIMALPEGSTNGLQHSDVTSLLDIYPTLANLCNLPIPQNLDGKNLIPFLRHPEQETGRSVISTYDFADYSVRKGNWHYIRYVDDSEELYNLKEDPEEWYNLAGLPDYQEIKADLQTSLPADVTVLPEGSLIPLMEHHIPPVTSKEFYFSDERKEWLKRFAVSPPAQQ